MHTGRTRTKRRRRTTSTNHEEVPLRSTGVHNADWGRVDELWFEDGNVTLIVEKKAFRIYRGLLARHSPVFRDMFTMSQPDGAERMNDCSVVHLFDDSPADLSHVLRISLGFSSVSLTRYGTSIPFSIIAALIRIGHKYQMEVLVDQAMSHLKSLFPASFRDFNSFEEHLRQSSVDASALDAFATVNISRLTGETSILPLALYVCTYFNDELLDGVEVDGRRERLTSEDSARCIAAKLKLAQAGTSAALRIFMWGDDYSMHCVASCEESFYGIMAELERRQLLATCTPLNS